MAPRVLCVVGPTASGKTKMAVALARRFGGEVVSVDSMQIYRGMTIGTAAPTAAEMEGVPHHMIAVADPAESWSVARFCQAADGCIQDILARGRLPVLAGGTGLYLDALIRGDDFAPGSQGGEVRLRLQRELRAEALARLEDAARTTRDFEKVIAWWDKLDANRELDAMIDDSDRDNNYMLLPEVNAAAEE